MIADVRMLQGEISRAVWYVCKYLTKSQQDLGVKGLRHVQTSRGIGSPKSQGDMIWSTAAYITARMFEPNTAILDLNTGRVIDNDFWEVHGFYPNED